MGDYMCVCVCVCVCALGGGTYNFRLFGHVIRVLMLQGGDACLERLQECEMFNEHSCNDVFVVVP